MTDSVAVLPPGWRALDDNGAPISGAKLKFYAAGTSTPKTVYADEELSTSLGTVVTCDAGGYPTSDGSARTLVYTGTALYKLVITTSADVTVSSHDSIKGAVAIPATDELALPQTPVISKTAAYSIVVGDQGKVVNANPTGGAFALTLPSAVTAEDGFRITIRHTGTSNAATIRATGSETITFAGQTKGSVALTGLGESMQLVSDGANWHVDGYAPPVMRGTLGVISITDRLTAPPTSPSGGARYIINGTPTGAWSTLSFSEGQVVEADGNGSWFAYTPADGWLAYVTDENLFTAYVGSAWADQTGMSAPADSTLGVASFEYQQTSGTVGGTPTTGAWTKATLNTTISNTIDDCSIASSTITLVAGTYLVSAWQNIYGATALLRLKLTSGSGTPTEITSGQNISRTSDSAGHTAEFGYNVIVGGVLTLTAAATLELQYYVFSGGGVSTSSLGFPRSLGTEVYAHLDILRLNALQGPPGEQGAQGADGLDAAYPYQWSTSTSGDPGSGKVAGNNATIASITEIAISETDSAGGSMAAVIALWDDSTSTAKARIKISKEGATQNFHAFTITGSGTDQGSYWTFPVSYVSTSGTISNADNCAVLVIEKGDKGDTGATGSAGSTGATGATGATGPNTGLDYAWATATSGDPGSGKVLANNATLSSATAVNISKTGRNGESLGAVLATWDDSTDTHKGHLRIFTTADRTEYLEAEVSGITDNSTYYTVAISATAGNGTPSADDVMAVMFERTGNKGADGAGTGDVVGPASSVDMELPAFDGTTGKLLQSSGLLIQTPGMYGALGGATDDTAALQAWLDGLKTAAAAGGRAYGVIAGTHKITSQLNLTTFTGRIEITGLSAELDCALTSGSHTAALYISNGEATGTPTTITADVAKGATDMTVASGSGLAAGDYVWVSNDTGFSTDTRAMLNRIFAIIGTDVTLELPLPFPITSAAGTDFTRAPRGSGEIILRGITFNGANATVSCAGLAAYNLINPRLSDLTFVDFDQTNGAGYADYNVWGAIIQNIRAERCGTNATDGIAHSLVSASIISNELSINAKGFGIGYNNVAGCQLSNIQASRTIGRSIKWASSHGNTVNGIDASCANDDSTGMAFSSGSSGNVFMNVRTVGTQGASGYGIWMNGTGNSDNLFIGVVARGNGGADITTNTTSPLADTGNVFDDVNDDAVLAITSTTVVRFLDGEERGALKVLRPAANTTSATPGTYALQIQSADGTLTPITIGYDAATGKAVIQTWGGLALDVNPLGNPMRLGGKTISPNEEIVIACSDETTALTTGTAKATFRMPYAMTLTAVRASVTTAPTGSVLTVDINESGVTILSTKLTIDASENTSTTAATPAVISDTALADDVEITIDIDGVGSSVAGAGLKVTLIGYRT